jgi:hypothetical protein
VKKLACSNTVLSLALSASAGIAYLALAPVRARADGTPCSEAQAYGQYCDISIGCGGYDWGCDSGGDIDDSCIRAGTFHCWVDGDGGVHGGATCYTGPPCMC